MLKIESLTFLVKKFVQKVKNLMIIKQIELGRD